MLNARHRLINGHDPGNPSQDLYGDAETRAGYLASLLVISSNHRAVIGCLPTSSCDIPILLTSTKFRHDCDTPLPTAAKPTLMGNFNTVGENEESSMNAARKTC